MNIALKCNIPHHVIQLALFASLSCDAATASESLAKLTPSDPASSGLMRFGDSVAVHGPYMAVGSTLGQAISGGAVHIFERDLSGLWLETQKISPSELTAGDLFGAGLSMAGNTLAIGSPGFGNSARGAVWIYERSVSGFWSLQQTILPTNADAGEFGQSVDIDADTLVVGAPSACGMNCTPGGGAVVVYRRDPGNSWVKNYAGYGFSVGAALGYSVAADDGVVVAGAIGDQSYGQNSGAVKVFAQGSLKTTLYASDAASFDRFGRRVSINGGFLAIGSADSVYVFSKDQSGSWSELQTFALASGIAGSPSLPDISLVGRFLLAGLGLNDTVSTDAGAVNIYERDPVGIWNETGTIQSPVPLTDQQFGLSVAIDSQSIVAGAPGTNGGFGAAYTCGVPPDHLVLYGVGCAGTGDVVPLLWVSGYPGLGKTITVGVAGGVGGGSALLFFGLQEAAIPMNQACYLNVWPLLPVVLGPLPLFPIGASGPGAGSISFQGQLPSTGIMGTFTIQAFVSDNGVSSGFSSTNGVRVLVD